MHKQAGTSLLVLGARGQVGWELTRALAPLGDVRALDRASVELSDLDAVRAAVRSTGAKVIVNAAAYTNVEQAETEKALAHRINAEVPQVLAQEARGSGALLVHYSTDYVFDGTSARPYVEDDATQPRTAYGLSKLKGDEYVLESKAESYIFRVGWVYGRRGHNFLSTIERLARERRELRIVSDQHGSPTWSRAIAEATSLAIGHWLRAQRDSTKAPPYGVYHMAAPDFTTWYEFASTIVASMPVTENWQQPTVKPIATRDYPTAAERPPWTVLDSNRLLQSFGIGLPSWRAQFGLCLDAVI